MFAPVSSKASFARQEEEVLALWKSESIFEKSLQTRSDRPLFVFFEGPPTANGTPGIHHVLARIFKDLINRHRTMLGYYVPRKGGWDTHGLPVELEIERELGLSTKTEIEAYGVERFNQRCRDSVFRYVKEWEAMTERIGFWLDTKDAYVTYKNSYVESCWWMLRQLWDKDLLYQGYKVTPYCWRCGTSLSSHEVAQGYREVDDPSVFVKFKVTSGSLLSHAIDGNIFLLAWTTTPWTLPGNVALAVAPEVDYVIAELPDHEGNPQRLVLAEPLASSALNAEFTVVGRVRGADLIGNAYEPLYRPLPLDKPAHRVVGGDFVSVDDGSGIVHIAPAFGEIDLEVGRQEDLPILQTVDVFGRVIGFDPRFGGLFAKDADPLITKDLRERGLLHRVAKITHTYPFCWRCNSPLLYYAKTSWYIKTTAKKKRLLSANEEINWTPEHIKHGRFGDWLENNVDWALSRERYWGTPLPIWRCQGCGSFHCVGSVAELAELSGQPDLASTLDLHRPYVDRIEFDCAKCGAKMKRVPEVIDAWFDSGAMPVCQWHYPFENQEIFKQRFPADFISEAVDQTRGWFYSLHALGVLLFDQPAFKNVIVLGHILDAKGEKMSKSRGNVVDPWEILNTYGADSLRWYMYTASPPGQPRRFSADLVAEVVRKFILTLWNTYSFFVTYANIDGFVPKGIDNVKEWDELDRWILSELQTLVSKVGSGLNEYEVTGPARAIQAFVDDLSNWYVRRSRRRFWKSESDADKLAAYETLYECLVTLSKLLAPFTPFLAEALYQNLVRSISGDTVPASVHLCDYPVAREDLINPALQEQTQLVMKIAGLGRAARSKANIKVRQPLQEVLVRPRNDKEGDTLRKLAPQITDELNVKTIGLLDYDTNVVEYQVKARTNVLGPKYGREIPALLKALQALNPADCARRVGQGQPIKCETWTIEPNEVEIVCKSREGYAVAEEGEYLVAVSTTLTPDLVKEGLARELVHRIQTMRKNADFRIEDHIRTYYQGDETAREVFDQFAGYIKQETLSDDLIAGAAPADAFVEEIKADGVEVTVGLVR